MAAKWSWAVSGSAWSNTTEQTIFSVAARVTKIEIIPDVAQSATAYVDFWDNANPTPGTTTPFLRIPVNSNTTRGLQRKISVSHRDIKRLAPNIHNLLSIRLSSNTDYFKDILHLYLDIFVMNI